MPATTPAELHPLFQDAFNAPDPDALAALYEPGAILKVDDKIFAGHEGVRTALGNFLALGMQITLETREVVQKDEGLAVLHAAWKLEPSGGPPAVQGMSTEIVRRQSDGTWLYIIDCPMTPQ